MSATDRIMTKKTMGPLCKTPSVIAAQCHLSSLCRLRDISLRPEGVFLDEGGYPHGKAPSLRELAAKQTEGVKIYPL